MEDDDAARGDRCAPDRAGAAGRQERHSHQSRPFLLLGGCARDALHRLRLFPRRPEASDDELRMRVRYFAWVRERVGHAEEEVDLPPDVTSVADLIKYLSKRDEGYAAAFAEPTVIRA